MTSIGESTYRPGYEIAAERILELVAHEGLQPGDRLPTEKQLAGTLQVSHTVAREAVKLLSARGQLTIRKGAGIFVAQPDHELPREVWGRLVLANLEHVQMLFECRATIEVETARLAAMRARPQQLRAIHDAAERNVQAAEEGDLDAFIQSDSEFHLAVAAAGHNMFFTSFVETITHLQRHVKAVGLGQNYSGALRDGALEHRSVAEAINGGDSGAAATLMRSHIEHSLATYQRAVQQQLFPGPRQPAPA